MDLRERHGDGAGLKYRHPWELSRTKKVFGVFDRYLRQTHQKDSRQSYINVGAGDLFFDRYLLDKYKEDTVSAVDLEYDETVPDYDRIEKFHYIEEVKQQSDYGMMMDSLEYMEDDTVYLVRKIQLLLNIPIDQKRKVTSHWNHSEGSVITRFLVWCLNVDFTVNRCLSKVGIYLQGLSLLVVCQKNLDYDNRRDKG